MKPNKYDYLKAAVMFTLSLLFAVLMMVLLLLGIFLFATNQVFATVVGLLLLVAFVVWFIGGSIHLMASSYAQDRLDKQSEM